MLVTVAGFKGGVGKSVTAIHLAAFFQRDAPTLLVDGDVNRSALQWAAKGSLPFLTVDEREVARHARNYEHIIADSAARPGRDDLAALARGADLLVLPTTAEAMAMNALMQTIEALRAIGTQTPYKALLTIVPPYPSRDGADARAALVAAGVPVFTAQIRQAAAFRKASLYGTTVREVEDPRALVCWSDYESVGEEILGVL